METNCRAPPERASPNANRNRVRGLEKNKLNA